MATKHVAAALFCHYSKKEISAENIKAIITSVGGQVENDVVAKIVAAVSGKDVEELIASGMSKLGSLAAAAAPAAGGAAATAGGAAAEAKEEKEPEEESDEEMGFGLFD